MLEWLGELLTGIGDALSEALGGAFREIWDVISSSVWDVFFSWLYESVYKAIGDFFNLMSGMGEELFTLPWVGSFVRLFSLFGWAMFLTGLVVAVFDTAVEYQSMRTVNIKAQVLPMIWGLLATTAFTVVPVRLYSFCLTVQKSLTAELAGMTGSYMTGNRGIGAMAYEIMSRQLRIPNFLNLLFLLALAYCVVKVFFQNIKRGGILLIQIAVGSLYLFGLPKGNTEAFSGWCRQVAALCLTAFLQVTLLYLGLMTWQASILLGLGVMLSAGEVPRIAGHFGLETGAQNNVMAAVRTTTTVVNMTRSLSR